MEKVNTTYSTNVHLFWELYYSPKAAPFPATASGIVRGKKSILRLKKYLTYKAGLEIATVTVILQGIVLIWLLSI